VRDRDADAADPGRIRFSPSCRPICAGQSRSRRCCRSYI
jgi:hypothetical protein